MENQESNQLSDIVDYIVDKAYKIIKWRLMAALNQKDDLPEGYFNYNQKALDEVVAMVKPLLSSAQQTRKVEAETSKSVITAVASGKLTLRRPYRDPEVVPWP